MNNLEQTLESKGYQRLRHREGYDFFLGVRGLAFRIKSNEILVHNPCMVKGWDSITLKDFMKYYV